MFDLTAQITTTLNSAALSDIKRKIQSEINAINGRIDIKVNAPELTRLNREIKQLADLGTQSRRVIMDLDASVGKLDNTIQKTTNSLIGLNSTSKSIGSNLSKVFNDADTAMQAFAEQTAIASRRFVAFSVAFQGIAGLGGLLKNAISESIAFNKEVIRIGQVSEDSFTQVKALGAEVGRLAQDLGVSSLELLKSGVLLKQAGLNTKDTTLALQALAKAALAPNFDDLASTTNGLIAAMQQFKLEGKDFESVLGSMNSVAGAFAVEAADLTEVVKKAGGVFASIKGDSKNGRDALNELLALFTSVRATTRESAEEIGSGLRTIFGRLQRPATIEALRALGVQLRYTKKEVQDNGLDKALEDQFVGGYEAIRRISQALNQIPATDARFAAIVEQIGGLRQLSRVTPLIQQFGEAQKALAVAEAGVNSLTLNSIQAQDSLANKITKVKENWLDLGRVLSDSSGFKSTFAQINLLSDGLVAILKTAGPLIPVLASLGAATVIKNVLPAVNNAFFNRQQYPGYKDNQASIRKNLADGNSVQDSLRNVNSSGLNIGTSNKILAGNASPSKDVLMQSSVAYLQKIMPEMSAGVAKRFVQAEFKNQQQQAVRANTLEKDATRLEARSVSQIKQAQKLKEKVSNANDYIKDLQTNGIGTSPQVLKQLRDRFQLNANANLYRPSVYNAMMTNIGHIDTYNNQDKISTQAKVLEARAERDKLKATRAAEEAKGIKDRQQIVRTVDALGRPTYSLPAAESRLKERVDKIPNRTGADTISGFTLASAEQQVTAKKIVAAGLQELTYINTSNRVRQAYIDGVSLQIQQANKSINIEQARIIAEEKYTTALQKNTASLNTKLFSNDRDKGNLIFDNSLGGGLTQGQAQVQRIKNAIMNNLGAISLAGPIIAGGAANMMGTAEANARSGNGNSYVAANSIAGGVTGATIGGLVTGGPVGAVVGGLLGLGSSLIAAKKQIADANLGEAVQKVADSFRNLSDGILELNEKSSEDILEQQYKAKASAVSSARYNNIFSTVSFNAGFGDGDALFSDIRYKMKIEARKTASSTILLVNAELAKQAKNSSIQIPESEQGFRKRILNQALDNNGGFLRKQVNEASFGTGIPVEQLLKKFQKQADEIFNNKTTEQANETTTRTITTFGLLNEAVIGAANQLKSFNNSLEAIFGATNGKFDFVKTTALGDNLKGSSTFDEKAMKDAVGSVAGLFGKESGSFQSQGQILGALKQSLPIILAEVRSSGNVAGADGSFETRILRALENNLGGAGLNQGKIGEALSIVASGLATAGPGKALEESNIDVTKLAEQILEPAMKPFIDSLSSIRKELESVASAYVQHLTNLASTYDKVNQRLEVVDKNAFDLQRMLAETQSRRSGGLAADVLPLPNIFNRGIDRLAPGLNNDPQQIKDKLVANLAQLANSQGKVDRAFNRRFDDKEGEANFRKVFGDFVKLQAETGNLQRALEKLSSSSEALAEIQYKLNNLKQIEQSQFSLSIRKLTADPTQRRALERGQEIFNDVRGGNQNIQDLSRSQRVKLFDFVSAAGPRERNTIEQQLRKEGLGLNQQDTKELETLIAEQNQVQAKALLASEKLVEVTRALADIQQTKMLAAQNALTAAIIKNTNILELQRKETQLGDIATKQQDANKPLANLTNIQKILQNVNPQLPVNEQDAINKGNLIASYGKLKAKIQQSESISNDVRRVFKEGISYDDTNTFKQLKGLFEESEGNDNIQKRENFIAKISSKFGISKESASGLVPNDIGNDSNKFLRNVTQNTGEFFRIGEGKITDSDKKSLADKRQDLLDKGLGGITTLNTTDLESLSKAIAEFNKFGKSVDEVKKTADDLADSFKKLKAEIDKNPESQQAKQVQAVIGAFKMVNPRGFAAGGIVNHNSPAFNPNGPDDIPAMLSKGEAIIPADIVRKNRAVIGMLLKKDNSRPENIRRKSPLGSLTRFAADSSLALGNDRLAAFGQDAYASNRQAFNEQSYLANAPTRNRPGIRDQYGINASILKDSNARTLTNAQDLYYSQSRKDFGQNKIFNPDSPQRQVNNALANGGQDKLAQNVQNLNIGFENFGRHVAALSDALNKQIRIDGEQNVNVNVVGMNGKDQGDIKDLVVATVKEKLGDMFPNFV